MLDRDFARAQVLRLSGLVRFPQHIEAVTELVSAIQTAPTEDAARAFIGDWLHTQTDTPTPCDIYQTFKPVGDVPLFEPRLEYKCKACSDTGFVPVERGGVSAVAPCACKTEKGGGHVGGVDSSASPI